MKENEAKTQSINPSDNKKGSSIAKKIINTIINILIVFVLIISLLVAVMALSAKASGGLSVIFGHTVENIQTDSMKGGSEEYDGGDFAAGDVIISKYTDFLYDEKYKVGDIVTYVGDINPDTEKRDFICHRIIEVAEYEGTQCYRTKGDYNHQADQEEGDYATYLRAGDIGSVFYNADYHGTVIKGFGNFLAFVQSKFGFFICILLPMILFFLYEMVRVIFNFAYYRKAKEEEAQEASEAEKQAAIDAAVAAALAKEDGGKSEKADNMPEGLSPEQMEQFKQFMELQKTQNVAKQKDQTTDDE